MLCSGGLLSGLTCRGADVGPGAVFHSTTGSTVAEPSSMYAKTLGRRAVEAGSATVALRSRLIGCSACGDLSGLVRDFERFRAEPCDLETDSCVTVELLPLDPLEAVVTPEKAVRVDRTEAAILLPGRYGELPESTASVNMLLAAATSTGRSLALDGFSGGVMHFRLPVDATRRSCSACSTSTILPSCG